VREDDRDAELQRALVLYAWSACCSTRCLRARWGRCWGRTQEMGCVDLDLLAPFGAHLLQRSLRTLQESWILNVAEADADAGGVGHGVCTDVDEVGGEGTGGRTEDELEGVVMAELQAGDFGRGVGVWGGDGGEALALTVEIERAQFRGCELDGRPFEGNRGLGNITDLAALHVRKDQ